MLTLLLSWLEPRSARFDERPNVAGRWGGLADEGSGLREALELVEERNGLGGCQRWWLGILSWLGAAQRWWLGILGWGESALELAGELERAEGPALSGLGSWSGLRDRRWSGLGSWSGLRDRR